MARDYVTIREEQRGGETESVETSVGRTLLKSAPAKVTRKDGQYRIVGAAWGAPIARVEVQVDDGPWRPATIDRSERRNSHGVFGRWIGRTRSQANIRSLRALSIPKGTCSRRWTTSHRQEENLLGKQRPSHASDSHCVTKQGVAASSAILVRTRDRPLQNIHLTRLESRYLLQLDKPSRMSLVQGRIMKRSALIAIAIFLAVATGTARADVVTDWNQTAIEVMKVAKVARQPWSRALAMMHVAMSDAINSVQNRYTRYVTTVPAVPGASAEAAAAGRRAANSASALPHPEDDDRGRLREFAEGHSRWSSEDSRHRTRRAGRCSGAGGPRGRRHQRP